MGWAGASLAVGGAQRTMRQLEEGLHKLKDRKYSVRIEPSEAGSLSPLAGSFNALGAVLREGGDATEQRERMLRLLIDSAPTAFVLLGDAGTILYTNESARQLFFEGRSLDGHNFLSMLAQAPEPFRQALLADEDSLFTLEIDGEQETWHVSKRHFEVSSETHSVIMVKHLTRELRRQEVDVWKKLIRVISHELNNSLAPITSLMHSARMIASDAGLSGKLDRVFGTVEERASHLQAFIAGYARFARLPNPRPEHVPLPAFVDRIRTLSPTARWEDVPDANGWFDPSQLEQVLINLLKNAEESSSPPEEIRAAVCLSAEAELAVTVSDRGKGMSEEVLRHALLPFYSTKERGTGLGLALCREIVEAHGGKIRIQNREGGGVAVTFSLPGARQPASSSRARLTLSRV
jgi:nitrogen fixation/metabolism regulation signal transduction histidine kinase